MNDPDFNIHLNRTFCGLVSQSNLSIVLNDPAPSYSNYCFLCLNKTFGEGPRDVIASQNKKFSSRIFHKKLKLFLETSLKHFCQTNLIQVMSFHTSRFFQKSTGCHAVAAKSLFWRQKMKGKDLF